MILEQQVLLTMNDISKSFSGVKALQSVNFELKAGEVHALLGENGAGKSTLIKILGGIYKADSGRIVIKGNPVAIGGVKDAQQCGISIIHQELVLVPGMTVAENIFLGREKGRGIFVDRHALAKEAQTLLDSHHIPIAATTLVGSLTIAQQQMVEIIKAISYQSKILVMDEPTSSISDKEVAFLFETIRSLTKNGVGVIYISHKMSELEEICDRVTVMRDGTVVDTAEVAKTTTDQLIAQMVGRTLVNYYTRDYLDPGEVVLRCEHLSDHHAVKDVSFELRKGQIIGFAGLVGSGRSETMQCLFGLSNQVSGTVFINEKPVKIQSPADAMRYGISLVPENRKEEGLFLAQHVRFNTTIEVLSQFIRGIVVNSAKEEAITQTYIDMMKIKTPSQEQTIENLSGGNQQKVMIGRWLATKPSIFILDEPTRGVDVGAKSEIYAMMNQLVAQGISIIMISSELPEIINMSDEIYVMREGKISGKLHHTEANQQQIMELATHTSHL